MKVVKVVGSSELVPVFEMRVKRVMKWSVIISLIVLGGVICLLYLY